MAAGNPASFLRISRPEIDLSPETDIHSEPVYLKGRENLSSFVKSGVLTQDDGDCYYVYRQKMGDIVQTGLVVCASVDDYQSGVIKKHELTRADKEEDRVRHIDALDANDEPVFYACRDLPELGAILAEAAAGQPLFDFTSNDGVEHTGWSIADKGRIERITSLVAAVPNLYVADGHHRSAAASRVRDLRKAANPSHTGDEEYNFFLTVIFPASELNIMAYNRAIDDLHSLSIAEFMAKVALKFEVTPAPTGFKPTERHQFGMFLAGRWYELLPREGSFDERDPVRCLDVSILQDNLLTPVLGIRNPRVDQRIHFIGGIRGAEELERLVKSGACEVAFSLYPTSIDELMKLADADKIMPPKSTWFEPKLRSGLFVHKLS
jgi:uncharacterized protein (DUF1015 family)